MHGFVIAGTSSGVGKTTLATGIIAALRARGLSVAPFKVGPDYIDPSYHARAAGRPAYNLDSWMVPPPALRETFARVTRDADLAVVEGVMGLFDGRSGGGEAGSTAEVAKLLGLPVILVVDAAKAARSVAAQVLGFQRFDPALHVAGVVLNNLASESHAAACREPVEAATGLPVLGTLFRNESLRAPERYLGLIPATEGHTADAYFAAAEEQAATHIDLDALLHIAAMTEAPVPAPSPLAEGAPSEGPRNLGEGYPALAPSPLEGEGGGEGFPGNARSAGEGVPTWPTEQQPIRARIAIADDHAFSFMYRENLDLLEAWGAEVVRFSPLADSTLPPDVDGIYLGGGFPELFAAELAANTSLLASLRAAAEARLPVYAECGGLMYLGQSLTDAEGRTHALAGVIPARTSLHGTRLTLGYREATARSDGPLLARGQAVRAHEFHWSTLDAAPEAGDALYAVAPDARVEGFANGHVAASYLHLHFASDARIAPRFVELMAQARAARAR